MLDELSRRAEQLTRNRETFKAYLAQLDDAALDAKRAEDEYSPRQTLAHLIGGTSSMTQIGRKMAVGENPKLRPDFDLNFFNARQQEKRAQRSLPELVQEWDAAYAELIAFMETLDAAALEQRGQHPVVGDTTLRGLLKVIVAHEADHINKVMTAIER